MRWWCYKPHSVTDQSLDSAAFIITTFMLAPRATCLCHFLVSFISSLLPIPISNGRCRRTSQLHPLPTSFTGTECRPTGSHPQTTTPASLRHSLYAPRCIPTSVVASHVVLPPVAALGLHPGPCRPLGVLLSWVSTRICVPTPSPCAALLPFILWAFN